MCTEDTYIDQGKASDRCRSGDLTKNGILGINLWALAGNVVVGTRRTTGERSNSDVRQNSAPVTLGVFPSYLIIHPSHCNFDQLPLSTSTVLCLKPGWLVRRCHGGRCLYDHIFTAIRGKGTENLAPL